MDADQVLAFRLARSGLASRDAGSLAEAAACPASDYSRHAALLALAARVDGVTRESYDAAVEDGSLVVAHIVRGAIHALAPDDLALYGRALLARGEAELGAQLGRQVRELSSQQGYGLEEALDAVADATQEALEGGNRLDRVELHEALRGRVPPKLLWWCKNCGSHHVPPMLWRYATVRAGATLDSERRYMQGSPGRAPAAHEAVRRYLRFYAPGTPGEFAEWAGLAKPHAKRLWSQVEQRDGVLPEDAAVLGSPPSAHGVRLLPPGDPFLQKPNRPLLAPDAELRKRLFRPIASPGAILKDGRLVGTWRAQTKGKTLVLNVEKLARFARADLDEEAARVAELRALAVRIAAA